MKDVTLLQIIAMGLPVVGYDSQGLMQQGEGVNRASLARQDRSAGDASAGTIALAVKGASGAALVDRWVLHPDGYQDRRVRSRALHSRDGREYRFPKV